jgi:hypothetical protein
MMNTKTVRLPGSMDHIPAHSVDPPGVLVLRKHWQYFGLERERWERWEIRKADSQVEFSDPLLHWVATGANPNGGTEYFCMRIDLPTDRYCSCGPGAHPGLCFLGALLHIDGRARDDLDRSHHVVYRIIGYNPRMETWIGRWPD